VNADAPHNPAVPGLHEAKARLRDEQRRRLAAVAPDQVMAESGLIVGALTSDPRLRTASTVLLFAALPGEPDLTALGDHLRRRGVRVALPRVDWSNGTMAPVPVVDEAADLTIGRHALREPRADLPALEPGELDAVIVPGLAFDRAGHRLGRGAGFYDRFLISLTARRADAPGPRPDLVGVALRAHLVAEVPCGPDDVRVHRLATPDGVFPGAASGSP
jgi:5-formyltetrahydrofolate cyclo-ligase